MLEGEKREGASEEREREGGRESLAATRRVQLAAQRVKLRGVGGGGGLGAREGGGQIVGAAADEGGQGLSLCLALSL